VKQFAIEDAGTSKVSGRQVWKSATKTKFQHRLETIRILIIDDNWFARLLAKNVLQALGVWNLEECDSPAKALELLKSEKFDLILLDHKMPKMTGAAFIRHVRALGDEASFDIPIVMVSSDTGIECVKEALNAGVHEFLAKPFTANGLVNKIASSLTTSRQIVSGSSYRGPCRRRFNLPSSIRRLDRRAVSVESLAA
jgi:two-component system chemotaxis response regulator CheY